MIRRTLRGWAWSLAAAAALLPAVAHAELYSWTDAEGVVHFTNIPQRDANRVAIPQSDNTWLWEDEEGKLQRLHRVDINAFDPIITAAAAYYTLPPALIKAVVAVESNFETRAVSIAGARGLMQLLPVTATQMMVERPFEASDNIYGGTRYLRILANRFGGDVRLTVAAYNCGPEIVDRVKGVPNIPETQAYVRRVLMLYRHYLTEMKATPAP